MVIINHTSSAQEKQQEIKFSFKLLHLYQFAHKMMWLKNGFRYNLLVRCFPLLNSFQYLFLLWKIVKTKNMYIAT